MPTTSEKKQGSTAAVAAVQFIGSIIVLIPSGLFLMEDLQLHRLYPQTYKALEPAVYIVYMVLPIGFGLTGIITSIGVWFLREWARKSTLFLAIVPATIYISLQIIRPASVFPQRASQGAILAVGDIYFDVVAGFVCALVPNGIWWLIFFTRDSVKAQFESGGGSTR